MLSCTSCKTVLVGSGNLTIGSILLISSLVFLSSSTRTAAASPRAIPCTLAWEASADSSIKGYALYYGVKNSTTTNRVDVGLTNQVALKSLYAASNYFFFVVSYNGSCVTSSPSALIYYTPPAVSSLKLAAATNRTMKVSFLAATNAACHVEYSSTLNPPQWQTLSSATADANGIVTLTDPLTGKPPSRFYRAVVP